MSAQKQHGSSDLQNSFNNYFLNVRSSISKEFQIKNVMEIPQLKKISLTISIGAAEKNDIAKINQDLTLIAGQKAVTTRAKDSIAAFKIREGMDVGAMVTLRGKKMYEFLDRFVYVALPRVRDFKGLKKSAVDSQFNYSIGFRDYTIFPEVAYNTSLSKQFGIGISFFISGSKNKEQTLSLLKSLNLPVNL